MQLVNQTSYLNRSNKLSKVLLNFMFALLILLPFHVALCQSDGEWQRFKTTFNRSYSSYEDEV